MKTRCRPGDRCVVVADVKGCECNVGAELTVTKLIPYVTPPTWEFKDASRALKMAAILVEPDHTWHVDPGGLIATTWHTETGVPTDDSYPGMFDHHLVPIIQRPAASVIEQPVAEAA